MSSYSEYECTKLTNVEGVSICELEKSLDTNDELCVFENHDAGHSNSAMWLLYFLIQQTSVENTQMLVDSLLTYENKVTKNVMSVKKTTDTLVTFRHKKVCDRFTDFIKALESNKIKDVRDWYTIYKTDKVIDVASFERLLDKVEFSPDLSNSSAIALKELKILWRKFLESKREFEHILQGVQRMMYVLRNLLVDIRERFPFRFILSDVVMHNGVSSRDVMEETMSRFFRLCTLERKGNKEVVTVNLQHLKNDMQSIRFRMHTMDSLVHHMCYKLLKYLYSTMGGSLRSILSLFLYILKTAETNNIHSLNQAWSLTYSIKPKEDIRTALQKLYTDEKKAVSSAQKKFKELMYSFFKIDISEQKWHVLCDRIVNAPNLDAILCALNNAFTVIHYKQYMLLYTKLLKIVKNETNKIIRRQNPLEKMRTHVNGSVEIPFVVFDSKINPIMEKVYNYFYLNFLLINREEMADEYRNMILTVNNVSDILKIVR